MMATRIRSRIGGGVGNISGLDEIFGTGVDGDAVISGTVLLPVPIAHQSVVERQYSSLIINVGALLRCAAHNAGLILRVQGDCTIFGDLDQSGLAPKTNPGNTFPYPLELICGDGGNGAGGTGQGENGNYKTGLPGGGMLKRPYGGGYSGASGGGGKQNDTLSKSRAGGAAGSAALITIDVPDADLFKGGSKPGSVSMPGQYGGGGHNGASYPGASGAGKSGGSSWAAAGAAGNYGGGVLMLYVGGLLTVNGRILCNGLPGGNGAHGIDGSGEEWDIQYGSGPAGGAGGGAIYIYYGGGYINTGSLQVNGGNTGANGTLLSGITTQATAGGIGSITVVQHGA